MNAYKAENLAIFLASPAIYRGLFIRPYLL